MADSKMGEREAREFVLHRLLGDVVACFEEMKSRGYAPGNLPIESMRSKVAALDPHPPADGRGHDVGG